LSRPERRIGPYRLRTVLLAGILTATVLCGGYLGMRAARIAARGYALSREVSALAQGNGLDPAALGETLPRIRREVTLLHGELHPLWWILERVGWVPWVGPTLQVVPAGAEAGVAILEVTAIVWEAGRASESKPVDDSDPLDALSRLVEELARRDAELRAACVAASQALAKLEEVKAEATLAPLRDVLARTEQVLPLLRAGLEAFPEMPPVLSTPGEWAHLLLAQNSDELRATGGFISSVGELLITDGRFTDLMLRDSYALDNWKKPHPDPPDPLQRYMGIDLWVTRDANWWPDFPTSARAVADLYELEQDRPVATILAVDMQAVARLLEVLAPLELPGGHRLEKGQVAEGFRQLWGLPEGALITDGETITTTHPYTAVEVELAFSHGSGEVWFDSVVLERTAQPGMNLVANGSFEQDVDGDGLPDHWEALGLTEGDGLTTAVAHDGDRSLHLRGERDREKRLTQRVEVSGEAGDVFVVSAMSRAEGVEAKSGPYALTVRFLQEDGQVERFSADFPPFTYEWASAGTRRMVLDWYSERKDFMGLAAGAAAQRMLSAPASVPWVELLATTRALLEERHIQVWSADDALQSVWDSWGWSGRLADPAGDYLLVVDSNVGYNKVTASVRQALDYRVTIDGKGTALGTLTLVYENTSPPEPGPCDMFRQYAPSYEGVIQGCYWNYVRVYAPTGSRLLRGSGADEPWVAGEECGKASFSTYLVLSPGERRELALEYLLPADVVDDGGYTLLVQRQAGAADHPLTVTVAAPGRRVVPQPGEPPATLTSQGEAVYTTDLRVDHAIAVSLVAR